MNILVAYDGSDGGRGALAAAAAIAGPSRGHLVVVYAVNPLTAASEVFAQSAAEALDITIRAAKVAIEGELLAFPDISAEARVEELQRGEDVADALLRVAETVQADLVATGSHRAGTVRDALLGGVASALVRGSKQPVILAQPIATTRRTD